MKTLHRFPRVLLAGLASAALLTPASAATTDRGDDLRERYEKKLALDFVSQGGWITDYDAARAKAKKEGKVLFVYFSRSYAP